MKIRILLLTIAISIISSCTGNTGLPSVTSKEYEEAIRAFYVGLGALQATEDNLAGKNLKRFTELAPGEPAGWVNLGVLALRQQNFDAAYEDLKKALDNAPGNSRIEGMLGLTEAKRGNFDQSITHLRKAVESDPTNVKAIYALAMEIERKGGGEAEAQKLIEQLLAAQPNNIAAKLELIRIAAKRNDANTVRNTISQLGNQAAIWPPEVLSQYESLKSASTSNVAEADTRAAFLKNVLLRLPEYRASLEEIKNPAEDAGEPFETFLKLPMPDHKPADPDLALGYRLDRTEQSVQKKNIAGLAWQRIDAVSLKDQATDFIVVMDANTFHIIGGGTLDFPSSAKGYVALDLNYDYKTDFVLLSAGGLRIFTQYNIEKFSDITSKTGLSSEIVNSSYSGNGIVFDYDIDGDLDVLIETSDEKLVVLRNNGNSTFKELHPFDNVTGFKSASFADIDNDGDPDLAFISKKGLTVFTNERLGRFIEKSVPPAFKEAHVMTISDINRDASMDIIVQLRDGFIYRLTHKNEGGGWDEAKIVTAPFSPYISSPYLEVADMDNNAALDIIAGNKIWLGDREGKFNLLISTPDIKIQSIADINNDGMLDVLGLAGDNLRSYLGKSTKNYKWQVIRPRAAQATGDKRINTFGIGSVIEIRAGLLFQKQVIKSQNVHFGMGNQPQTDIARIIWPNGIIQGEFELKADQAILAEQRLKGSCPSLFTWNGKSMEFIKDIMPWGPALGLRLNDRESAIIDSSESWVKIPGDKIQSRDNYYDLRITAELWETYYVDRYKLMAVDHPIDTEIFVDERFAIPAPPLKMYVTSRPNPFKSAKDDKGRIASHLVDRLDDVFLNTFVRGSYQGITEDHYVELEVPDNAPVANLLLLAHGFVRSPENTDTVAMTQNVKHVRPYGVNLEVWDKASGWKPVQSELGVPAGKNKTMIVDLSNIFTSSTNRRFRLKTNLEIYWDKLEWAERRDNINVTRSESQLVSADLKYRGFSVMNQKDNSSPEIPAYQKIDFSDAKWRDITGYYTRYGDITELLHQADDRYVIVNAGDEMVFKFKAMPDPSNGYKRDYVFIGNGWIKEGDFNSTYSQTVLPMPYKNMRVYKGQTERLEDDPVYKQHPEDWLKYHTRYVSNDRLNRAMLSGK